MNPDSDGSLAAILACTDAIRPEHVEAELEAAMSDPLLQATVDRAVSDYEGSLSTAQLAEARAAFLISTS